MSQMIFVNLPVSDVAASTRFYEAIGCRKNEQFSDDKASSMVWSDKITLQLLTRDYFATFSTKPVADAHAACQVMLCLSRDSRAAIDMSFIYNRAFEDPDGHAYELVWMNPNGMP